MNIWVDADACPVAVKDILFRAAQRKQITTTLIANHPLRVPNSPYLQFYQVEKGFDVADNEIIKRISAGDLLISSDIPLAAEAINSGATVLSPRGELYTQNTIQARLSMRNFMDELRSSGVETGGQRGFSHTDRKAFADQLDKILNHLKS
jgi:uncharacterized protein YaiI (UPF0178 family)